MGWTICTRNVKSLHVGGGSGGGSSGSSGGRGGSGGPSCSSGDFNNSASTPTPSTSRSGGSGSSGDSSGSNAGGTGHPTSSTSNSEAATLSGCKRKRIIPSAAAKLRRIDALDKVKDLDLESLLHSSSNGGRHILEGYRHSYLQYEEAIVDEPLTEAPILSENQRSKLVQIIVDRLLDITDCPTNHMYEILAKKVVDLFECEVVETYYIAPKTESKDGHPKGKFFHRVKNVKSRRNTLALYGSSASPSTSDSSTQQSSENQTLSKLLKQTITEEIQLAAKWLANGRSPWPLVLAKWRLTAPLRFQDIFSQDTDCIFINKYIEDWSVLSHKSGHELILEDFKLMRPKSYSKLLENWDTFVRKLTVVASRDIKDKTARALLAEGLDLSKTSQNQDKLAFIVLRLLPYIRPNHFYMVNGNQVKARVDLLQDSYMVVVQKETDIKHAIESRRNDLIASSGSGGQPLIVIVECGGKINSTHVSVATLRYKLDSLVETIDVFFKSFHVFNLVYPNDIKHILVVLQRAVFGFSSQWDGDVQHSWIKACKC